MATTATVPDVSSATTSAPASAPASAPETTAAPATTSTPTAPKGIGDFEGPEDFLDSKIKEIKEKTKTAAPAEAEAETEPVVEVEAAPEGEGEQTEEEKAAAAAKAAEEAKTEEPVEELEDGEILSPQAFAKELGKDPAAKAFFDNNPEMRNRVFAALRRDSENRELRQYFPDVETAKQAAQNLAQFSDLDTKFLAATDAKGAHAFMQSWYEMALVRDEQGNPVKDAAGNYEVTPAWNAVNQHIFNEQIAFVAETAKKSGNAELSAALDIIREAIPDPSRPKDDDLPAHVKAAADAVKAREDALNRAQREQQEGANVASLERVATQTTEKTTALLTPAFDKAGMTEFEREAATEKIDNLLIEKLTANPLYLPQRNRILAQKPGEAREKQLLAHDMRYINQYLGPIAAQVINQAKAGAINRQTVKQTKINSQIEASKTEPRGTSAAAPPQKTLDPKAMKAQIQKEYADTHNGEPIPAEELIAKVMERTRAQIASRGRV